MHAWLSHSCYSFLHGASTPEELLHAAHAKGYEGLCLADTDGVYGLAQFFLAEKKLRADHEAVTKSEHNQALLTLFAADFAHVHPTHPMPRAFFAAQILLRVPRGFDRFTLPTGEPYDADQSCPLFLQHRITLVARSRQGYAALCGLLSYTNPRNSIGLTKIAYFLGNFSYPFPK